MKKDPLYPLATDVINPSTYNIEKEMREMVKHANQCMNYAIIMDVGKVIGLYKAWKNQKEVIELFLKEQER